MSASKFARKAGSKISGIFTPKVVARAPNPRLLDFLRTYSTLQHAKHGVLHGPFFRFESGAPFKGNNTEAIVQERRLIAASDSGTNGHSGGIYSHQKNKYQTLDELTTANGPSSVIVYYSKIEPSQIKGGMAQDVAFWNLEALPIEVAGVVHDGAMKVFDEGLIAHMKNAL